MRNENRTNGALDVIKESKPMHHAKVIATTVLPQRGQGASTAMKGLGHTVENRLD